MGAVSLAPWSGIRARTVSESVMRGDTPRDSPTWRVAEDPPVRSPARESFTWLDALRWDARAQCARKLSDCTNETVSRYYLLYLCQQDDDDNDIIHCRGWVFLLFH